MRSVYLLSAVILLHINLAAQGFTRYDSIPVTVNSNTLKFGWCGGLNYPQVYKIDINGDGIKDIFVYDKSTTKHRTYIGTGATGDYNFKYVPQYEWRFPGPFSNWVQLFDFNCDGKEDIFTYNNGFIRVWKNNYNPTNGLTFSLYINILYAFYPSSGYSNILLSSQTHPAFTDVDNDGDLDLLVYGISVDWYQNMAKENFNRCDTLVFNYADNCWGRFSSFGNPMWNTLTFNSSCRSNGAPPDTTFPNIGHLHLGQSILALDLDGDLDKDVLIGDVIQNNITEATNGGTPATAFMVSQDTAFPNYSVPVASTTLNVCDFIDVNNDNKRDLLVSPFQPFVSDNFLSVWYYKNTGTDASPVFTFQNKNYLQSQMIETGEGCYPVFFDYDFDGKPDLIIGNYGYYSPQDCNGFLSGLSLYKNTGSITSPSFDLVTRDFGRVDSICINNAYPAFGDLDGDGDIDMLVGEEFGHLKYYNNTAGVGNACSFVYIPGNYQNINANNFCTPQLIDVDRDTRLDLIMGGRNGAISYYRNTGTSSSPAFTLVTQNFGGVNVRKGSSLTGFSVPCMFDSAGSYRLLVGSESGYLYYYKNIDGNLSGNFTLVDSMLGGIWEGTRTAPFVKDVNGDGLRDLVVGNYSGGVAFFKGDLTAGIGEANSENFEFTVFPNPAADAVMLHISAGVRVKEVTLHIYNILGGMVRNIVLPPDQNSISISTADLPPGVYFFRMGINGAEKTSKLIITR